LIITQTRLTLGTPQAFFNAVLGFEDTSAFAHLRGQRSIGEKIVVLVRAIALSHGHKRGTPPHIVMGVGLLLGCLQSVQEGLQEDLQSGQDAAEQVGWDVRLPFTERRLYPKELRTIRAGDTAKLVDTRSLVPKGNSIFPNVQFHRHLSAKIISPISCHARESTVSRPDELSEFTCQAMCQKSSWWKMTPA
jgi:hypothetical protein